MSVRLPAALLLVLMFFLAGCSPMTGERLQSKVPGKLAGVERYFAEMEAEIFSLEGEQAYYIRQWVEQPNRWRVEVQSDETSQVFICDGRHVYVYQPGIDDYYRVELDGAQESVSPPFYLAGYLEQLVLAGSINYQGESEWEGYAVYLVTHPGPHRDEETTLRLDKKTYFPYVVETNMDGEPQSRITCKTLDLKPDFAEDLFLFDPPGEGEVASHCLIQPLTPGQARQEWPHPIYMPAYLPQETFLFVISRGEEEGREQLVFIYKGGSPFILVQSPATGNPPFLAEATREVRIGEAAGHYHPNSSGELSTLWWSNDTTTFILTGDLPLEEMTQIAASLEHM